MHLWRCLLGSPKASPECAERRTHGQGATPWWMRIRPVVSSLSVLCGEQACGLQEGYDGLISVSARGVAVRLFFLAYCLQFSDVFPGLRSVPSLARRCSGSLSYHCFRVCLSGARCHRTLRQQTHQPRLEHFNQRAALTLMSCRAWCGETMWHCCKHPLEAGSLASLDIA